MLTVAIPTLNRGWVLIETLRKLMAQEPVPSEILVLDQTKQHEDLVRKTLSDWRASGKIRWFRLDAPSITKAMNLGLTAADCEIVLFVDDDIVPAPGLVSAHLAAHGRAGVGLVAGRVIQPWEQAQGHASVSEFHFAQEKAAWISEFMAGNFSVRRDLAIALGGFDENFVRVGYRFEAEFAYRLRKANYRIYFEPAACIHHLKSPSGGTRIFGNHLRSCWPDHSVGDYYFNLRTWAGWPSLAAFANRFARAIINHHHLRRPWWIPATAVAELSGMMWALFLNCRGPRYLRTQQRRDYQC
jgi:GT2 family glycosyltransferase